ncbi:MAG TPA: trypsin-like peptidase domain-containing protein [Gemmatimonadaceae bacterium]|jgi:S1-C subfamily serine protease|nr:trypsin-like peptidase domain-containing protein [Gemmatimonadaceae bacterium]
MVHRPSRDRTIGSHERKHAEGLMPIELRIVSGARAGQSETFDKSLIAIGRHPTSDLRFDVKQDLDVSTRHGEIRFSDGRYTIYDNQSTNGTFVNGVRVPAGGSRLLQNGDTVMFGAHGPQMQVRIGGQAGAGAGGETAVPRASRASAVSSAPSATSAPSAPSAYTASSASAATAAPAGIGAPRRPTTERVAIAVKEQTRWMRLIVAGVVVLAAVIAGGALWFGHLETRKAQAQIDDLIKRNGQVVADFQQKLHGDTQVVSAAQRRIDSLTKMAQAARGEAQARSARDALTAEQDLQRKISNMGLPAIRDANDPAIVLLNVEFGNQAQEATGFCVNASGLIVTNQHVVEANGAKATKIHVKFANSRTWRPAHLVKVDDDPKVDLALVQLDQPGHTPSIAALAPTMDAPVGSPVSTLGFPDGTSTPMDGTGNDLAAKTTLTVGTISKSITADLQLDSFATHGSSGSPVFDTRGQVIGVIWGGPCEVNCPIVYAVPVARVTELIKTVK